jgi:SAM-dependent methyltransferase
MNPADYESWYETKRGRWVGETEYRLLNRLLAAKPYENLLDVGCGTGWFTRQFSAQTTLDVTGIDLNAEWITYARSRDAKAFYLTADARALPFASGSFDLIISMAALCFIDDWPIALQEIIRVTRSRFVVGFLNKRSLLWCDKGQSDNTSAYYGAHWHSEAELRAALNGLPVCHIHFHTVIFLPSGSRVARTVECVLPNRLPWGSCIVISGDIKPSL